MTERVHQAYPVPINIADAAGITRLHLASRAGNLEAVRRLLHSGADPNTATEDGVTPLALARSRHHQDIAQRLEEKGAIEEAIEGFEARSLFRPELYQRYSPPIEREVPGNLQEYHAQEVARSQRLPGSPSAYSDFGQHCDAGSCGYSASVIGDSPRGFRFRRALGAIGRGEDPISQFVDQVERVQDNVIRFVTDRHPTLQAISISSREVAGSFVAEQVDLLDRATGRVISQNWNQLDQNLKDEFNGLLKLASVVPITRAKLLTEFRRYLDNVDSVPRTKLVSDMERVGLTLKGLSPDGRFMEFVDKQGNVRAKIHPPDKVTPYNHLHIYDRKQQPLDKGLNYVDQRSPDAHIKISGNEQ